MPYLSSMERSAKEEGINEGLLKAIAKALECKFGAAGLKLLPRFRTWQDTARLEALVEAITTATEIKEIRKLAR